LSIDNKIITAIRRNGSFQFPIEFNIFNNPQSIENAVFDTGCGHSLISINSLQLNKPLEYIKNYLFYSKNSYLCTNYGIDTPKITQEISNLIQQINKYKQQSKNNEEAYKLIYSNLSEKQIQLILNATSIRFSYKIKNLSIDEVPLGDYTLLLSLNTDVNLIGMHIIRDLYTKIHPEGEYVRMYAIKKPPNTSVEKCETEINDCIRQIDSEIIDFYEKADEQVLESNYISRQLNKNQE